MCFIDSLPSCMSCLYVGCCRFYPRWKECESLEALSLHFSLEENQWHKDWAILLSIASQPGKTGPYCRP